MRARTESHIKQTKSVLQRGLFDTGKRVVRDFSDEHGEQCAFVSWLEKQHPAIPFFSVPNGGYRHKAIARKLKAEGVQSGVPDLCIPYPINGYYGLFIEMKRKSGVPSDVSSNQKRWLKILSEQGYKTAVAFGCEHAQQILTDYIDENY